MAAKSSEGVRSNEKNNERSSEKERKRKFAIVGIVRKHLYSQRVTTNIDYFTEPENAAA